MNNNFDNQVNNSFSVGSGNSVNDGISSDGLNTSSLGSNLNVNPNLSADSYGNPNTNAISNNNLNVMPNNSNNVSVKDNSNKRSTKSTVFFVLAILNILIGVPFFIRFGVFYSIFGALGDANTYHIVLTTCILYCLFSIFILLVAIIKKI